MSVFEKREAIPLGSSLLRDEIGPSNRVHFLAEPRNIGPSFP